MTKRLTKLIDKIKVKTLAMAQDVCKSMDDAMDNTMAGTWMAHVDATTRRAGGLRIADGGGGIDRSRADATGVGGERRGWWAVGWAFT